MQISGAFVDVLDSLVVRIAAIIVLAFIILIQTVYSFYIVICMTCKDHREGRVRLKCDSRCAIYGAL